MNSECQQQFLNLLIPLLLNQNIQINKDYCHMYCITQLLVMLTLFMFSSSFIWFFSFQLFSAFSFFLSFFGGDGMYSTLGFTQPSFFIFKHAHEADFRAEIILGNKEVVQKLPTYSFIHSYISKNPLKALKH